MFGTFHSLWNFDVSDQHAWLISAQEALVVLQAKSGFIKANVLHSADDPSRFVVQTEWQDVGSYRKALGSTEAKIGVWPFLADMHDEVSAFEELLQLTPTSIHQFESSVDGEFGI
jgi:quinol monooxygenase YgiN